MYNVCLIVWWRRLLFDTDTGARVDKIWVGDSFYVPRVEVQVTDMVAPTDAAEGITFLNFVIYRSLMINIKNTCKQCCEEWSRWFKWSSSSFFSSSSIFVFESLLKSSSESPGGPYYLNHKSHRNHRDLT